MVDVKMTNIVVSTSQFLATLSYPVKNKITYSVTKKTSVVQESIDAVIEVTPIVHRVIKPKKNQKTIAQQFYDVLSCDAEVFFTKAKQRELTTFLEACGDKVRQEIKESCQKVHLENLEGRVEHVFVNLLDQAGNLVQSTTRTPHDILAALHHLETKILLWGSPKKRPSLFAPVEHVATPKPRRKEKIEKEGGIRRYIDCYAKKAA